MTPYPSDLLLDSTHAHQLRHYLSEAILVQEKKWLSLFPRLNNLVYRIFQVCPFSGDVTVRFDNDYTIQKLNKQFRGINKPTNVLTFEHSVGESCGGDIILALQTIRREATQNHKIFSHHLAHLIIHGLLHLQGYDHIYVNDAKEMEMKEAVFLHKLGIPNPWKINSLRSI